MNAAPSRWESLAALALLLAAGAVPLLLAETAEPFGPVKEILLALALLLALPAVSASPVVWPGWLAAAALTMAVAPLLAPRGDSVTFFELARPALRLLLLMAAAVLLQRDRWRRLFFRVTALAALVVSLLALLQYYAGAMPAWHIRQSPMAWSYRGIWSTLGNPNYLAEYLVLALFPSLVLFWERRWFWRGFGFVSTALSIFVIVLSFSRAGWLVLFAGSFAYLFLLRRIREFRMPPEALYLLVFVAMIGLAVFATENPLNRGSGLTGRRTVLARVAEPTGSLRKRMIAWQITAAALPEKPWTGHGAGSFSRDFLHRQADWLRDHPDEAVFWDNFRQVHNDWLQDAYETGALGFLAAAVFFFGIFGRALAGHSRNPTPATAAAASSIAAYLLFRTVAFPDHLPASAMLCLLLAGLGFSPALAPAPQRTGWRRILPLLLILPGLLAFVDASRNVVADRASLLAARALRHRQLDEADRQLKRAESLRPTDRTRFLQGTLAAARGDYSGAETLFLAALQGGDDPNIWYNIGLARLGQGAVQPARAAFEQTLAIFPYHFTAIMPLARIHFQSGLYRGGIELLQRLVRWREPVFRNGDLYNERLPEMEVDAERAFVQEMILRGLSPGPSRLRTGGLLLRFCRLRPRAVQLLPEWTNFQPLPMTEGEFPGVWEIRLPNLPPGLHRYFFQTDDGEKITDPFGETVTLDGESVSLLRGGE